MTDCWGYVRLSQQGRDTSIEKQKESLRKYCSNNDLNLVTTLNDGKNTSGFDTNREKYQTLIERIDAGKVGAVVVRDRARLSRDFDERLRLITMFRQTGCELHVVEAGGKIEIENVQTAAMEAVHAGMDHAKKMAEIERTRDAVEERMSEDYDHGPPRFGMRYREDGQYQEPADNFEKVEKIWQLREDGCSYSEIEKQLGVPSSTAQRVVENRDWYIKREEMAQPAEN